jgi:hypothetical protein
MCNLLILWGTTQTVKQTATVLNGLEAPPVKPAPADLTVRATLDMGHHQQTGRVPQGSRKDLSGVRRP